MPKTISLDKVVITPQVLANWTDAAPQIARLAILDGILPEEIPDEHGRVEDDGTLTIYIRFQNGMEVSMNVPSKHWEYA